VKVFKDWKIGKRLGAGFACVAVLMVIIAALGIYGLYDIRSQMDRIARVNVGKISASGEARVATMEVILSFATMALTRDPALLERESKLVELNRAHYKKAIEELDKLEINADGKKLIEDMKQAIGVARDADNKTLELAKAGKSAEAGLYFAKNARPAILKVGETADAVVEYNLGRMKFRQEALAREELWLRIIMLSIGILMLGFCGLLGFMITRSITLPLDDAAKHMDRMAEGDFSLPISEGDLARKDELGNIAQSMKAMNVSLGRMFKDIDGGIQTLASSATELSAISKQMSSGAEQTSGRANMVATAAEEMSSNVTSVAAAMEQASTNVNTVAAATEEMTSTVGEIARNSEKARDITGDAVNKAVKVTSQVEELGKAAREIGKVTEAINSISAQTNLLALNATIEAARAGSAGKGFAVVANEIKELAQQTAGATEDIKNKIEAIQTSTAGTVSDIERISTVIKEVNDIVSGIAVAIEEQSTATREIATNIGQAAQGIMEVNQNVAQTSTVAGSIAQDIAEVNQASGEISSSGSQVLMSAQELSNLSEQLKSMVSRFKL
jgi:methyl-accepting chemotaxis protein